MAPTPKSTAAKATARKTPARGRSRRAEVPAPEADVRALISARLEALACDPIAIIARIAIDEGADARLRLAAAKELAAYMLARPRRGAAGDGAGAGVDIGAIIARAWAAGAGS